MDMKFRIKESREIIIDATAIPKECFAMTSDAEAPTADTIYEIIEDIGVDDLIGAVERNAREVFGACRYISASIDVDPVETDPPAAIPVEEAKAELVQGGAGAYAGSPEAAEDHAPDYSIEILDHGFEPGTYGGWTVQFRLIDGPRLSYQKQDPILEAFVKLERAPDDAPKLSAGGGSALARTDESTALADAMMGGGTEGNILRGFSGAAVVESAPVVFGNAPVSMPSDEAIAEACGRSVKAHLAAVAEERKRLAVTEGAGEGVIGKRLKVKG